MDPNWFYSSLAQSAAAIVGLFAGFLLTHLQRQRTEVLAAKEAWRRDLLDVRQIAEAAVPATHAHTQELTERVKRLEQAQKVGTNTLSFATSTTPSGPVMHDPPLVLSTDQSEIDKVKAQLASGEELVQYVVRALSAADQQQLATLAADLRSVMERGNLAVRPVAFHLFRAIERARGTGQLVVASALIRTPVTMVSVLIFLAVVSVLLPLARLSAHSVPERNLLLVLFGAGLAMVVAYLAVMIFEMKFDGRMDAFSRHAPK